MGTGSFQGVRQGRDANPSPPSSAEVKNRVELYLYERVKPTHNLLTKMLTTVKFTKNLKTFQKFAQATPVASLHKSWKKDNENAFRDFIQA